MASEAKSSTLLIDIGNSSLKWAIKRGAESNLLFESFKNFESVPLIKFDSVPVFIDVFIGCWKNIEKPKNIIVSCVAQKDVWLALVAACDDLWGINIQKIESLEQGYGLVNGYKIPAELGTDRWCAMVGALKISKTAFLVVDVGSAITIDLVNELGHHLGGTISPGLAMMAKSLGVHTAQVKVGSIEHSSLALGRSTKECVDTGILMSAVKLIEAIYLKELGQQKELKCYLTGGDADIIANSLSIKYITVPDLVLRGLAEIQKGH